MSSDRPQIMARFGGPGPNNYALPPTVGYEKHDFTRLRNPAYSMGARTGIPNKNIVPGPQYDTGNYTRYGKNGDPKYSMGTRLRGLTPFTSPGPDAYKVENVPRMKESRPPKYSLASRNKERRPDQTPGPNAYKLPDYIGPKIPNKEAAAAYSMGTRNRGLKGFQSPGPAQYGPGNVNLYKQKLPQYSMSGRNRELTNRSPNPGPAGYNPMYNFNKNQPKFSFGVKHSEFSPPLVTEEDNM